jgi:hypothetical protein
MDKYKVDTSFFDKIPSHKQIDEAVTQYVKANNGKKPRFILMDEITRSAFSKICYAKERIKLADATLPEGEEVGSLNLTHFWTTDGGVLEVLTVKKDPMVLEIVG